MSIISQIDLRFRSGNSIPADRAYVRVAEWEAIKALVAAVDAYRSSPDFENGRSMDMALTALTKQEGRGEQPL